MPGFPDWQSFPQWTGDPFINEDGTLWDLGPTQFGPFQLAHFKSLLVMMRPVAPNFQVLVNWVPSAAPSQLLRGQIIATRSTAVRTYVLPVVGDRIEHVQVRTDVANNEMDLYVAPTNLPPGSTPPVDDTFLLTRRRITLTASGGNETTVVRPYAGRALFAFSGEGTNWDVELDCFDYDATLRDRAFSIQEHSGTILRELFLPPLANQLTVVNNDSSNRQYTATLSAYWPGV